MKKVLWILSFVCVLFCSCCSAGGNDSVTQSGDTVTKKCMRCQIYEESIIKDTLFGQGYVSYYPQGISPNREIYVHHYNIKPKYSVSEFYYCAHKYISFNGRFDNGMVHAPDCWCMETHRDTIVYVHHDTTYLTVSQKKVDEIVRKSIEKNLEKYFQNLIEKNEKIIPADLH